MAQERDRGDDQVAANASAAPSARAESSPADDDLAGVYANDARPRRDKLRVDHAVLGTWWRVTSRDNVTTFYGLDDASRIFDPATPSHVFQWLPVIAFDDKGNCTVYEYKPEDLVSVPPARADANRRSGLAR